MPLILNIETATEICSVGIAKDGKTIAIRESSEKNPHAALTTIFVQECLAEAGVLPKELDAVAVSEGPGSYTGLRIGFSVAKGMCYALDIPLITVPTLDSLIQAGRKSEAAEKDIFYCSMIDARRMEVYMKMVDSKGVVLHTTSAEILTEEFLGRFAQEGKPILFSGNGAWKVNEVLSKESFLVKDIRCSARNMEGLSYKAFLSDNFADLAYAVPFYLKSPHITRAKKRL